MIRERPVIFLPLRMVLPIIRIVKDLDACEAVSDCGRDMLRASPSIKWVHPVDEYTSRKHILPGAFNSLHLNRLLAKKSPSIPL